MMDQSEDHKLHTVGKFNKQHFLRRTVLLAFSVSLFSLLLSYSSGFSCFLHSFNLYYSTFLFSLITHTLERKYMFLICNGIVAFLAGHSGFGSSAPPGSGISAEFLKRTGYGGSSASQLADMKPLVVDKEATVEGTVGSLGHDALVVEEDQDQQQENEPFYMEEQERESRALIVEDGEGEEETESLIPEAAEEEEEMKENEELTSTEELNKKIEDFIRRMKEELRVEAQSQLITV
ncbi:hypothetical protein PVL29_012565 [Vitis rotundifolia]|uniref:Uncharacterized protein n=1 Tax=Vitis rotundifolia TaxID=103349 RepID=A0AA39DPY5_VITRO|nr:hypothetical protein PVL29_012565 [Vitis rotundifolia]